MASPPIDFILDAFDALKFRRLKTNFYNRFLAKAVVTPRPMVTKLRLLVEEIQRWTIAYPVLTGSATIPFTAEYSAMILEQACPMMYEGSTIIGIAGNEVTYEDNLSSIPFLKGSETVGSEAGFITRRTLNRVAQQEAERHEMPYDDQVFDPLHITLWNFWTWQWDSRTDMEQAVSFSRRYWHIVRPRIIVSYGEVVTGVVLADFRSTQGLSQFAAYLDVVGRPTIQFHSDKPNPDDDDAFICIPHIDPGQNEHADPSTVNELRRMIELTWQLTMAIGDITLDVVHTNSFMRVTRLHDLEEILKRWREKCNGDPATIAFNINFEGARNELRNKWRKLARESELREAEKPQPLLAAAIITKIRDVGIAQGEPDSFERQYHLGALWNKKIADLHRTWRHNAYSRKDWQEQFLHLPEGQLLFIPVIMNLTHNTSIKKLVKPFRPEWMTEDDWSRATKAQFQEAVVSCEQYIATQETAPQGRKPWI